MDIGNFFIDDCCIEAGFDKSGNQKIKKELKMEGLPSVEDIKSEALNIQQEKPKNKRNKKEEVKSED
jgi:hypothetical protein